MQPPDTDSASIQDLDNRIIQIQKMIKKAPLLGDLWAQLGFTIQVKDIRFHDSGVCQKEALFAYQMALKLLDPVSNLCLVVWHRMGLLLKTMGKFQEAVDVHVTMVAKLSFFPLDRAVSLHYAGDALVAMNKPLMALVKYRNALSTYPKHLISYLGVVNTLIELNTSKKSDWYALLHQMYCAIGSNVVSHSIERPATLASTLQAKGPKTAFDIPSAFYFAMFKAANCVQEHAQAWWLLDKAHQVQKEEKNFLDLQGKIDNIRINASTIKNVFNAGFWPSGVGHSSVTPVFIVGMMRSGSTLLEHILDAHSGLVGIGEDSAMNHFLPSLLKQIQECMQPTAKTDTATNYFRIKKLINDIGSKVITRMTSKALDAIEVNEKLHPIPGATNEATKHPVYIIDKMLFNYRNVGLIHLVFPNAIILHTIRDPLDTIFGCYKLKFDDAGLDWSMDLASLCAQYQAYLETMDHWEKLLPGRVHHVIYEDLVLDTEREARRIVCDILGLPWENSVLEAHSRLRAVHTHSMGQVRHKVHRSAVGGWKKYGDMLLPIVQPLLKPVLRHIDFTSLFPTLNWDLDINFVQQSTARESILPTGKVETIVPSVSAGLGTVAVKVGDDAVTSPCGEGQGRLPIPAPVTSRRLEGPIPAHVENPFSSYGKLIDMSINYDKLFHLEGVVKDLKCALSFDTPSFSFLTTEQMDFTQGLLLGAMTVNRALIDRLAKSFFIVNPLAMEDISLFCLLLGLARKQAHFSSCLYSNSALNENHGVTYISFCVNKQL